MSPAPLSFDWKEVGCFLRPQAVLCDRIASGYGLLLLFATSFYRTYGFRGYFVDSDKQHFAFARSIFRELSGLEYRIAEVRADELQPALRRRLRDGAHVLVPANIRELPWFQGYRARDQAHWFIVTAFDEALRTYSIWDTLHASADHSSTEYSAASLSEETFSAVTAPRESPWLLEIHAGDGFRARTEQEILRLIGGEYAKLARTLDGAASSHASFDDRYLGALEAMCERREMDAFEQRMRAYLVESNFCGVHLKILRHVIPELGPDVDAYNAASASLRRNLLIQCLMPRAPSRARWDETRSSLASLLSRLRLNILSRTGFAHG